ncbi:MAG: hypothetical protein ACJAXA_003603 [Candidatus Aldehydirespiratoraceae bacterium]|jgi:hypothetical protein
MFAGHRPWSAFETFGAQVAIDAGTAVVESNEANGPLGNIVLLGEQPNRAWTQTTTLTTTGAPTTEVTQLSVVVVVDQFRGSATLIWTRAPHAVRATPPCPSARLTRDSTESTRCHSHNSKMRRFLASQRHQEVAARDKTSPRGRPSLDLPGRNIAPIKPLSSAIGNEPKPARLGDGDRWLVGRIDQEDGGSRLSRPAVGLRKTSPGFRYRRISNSATCGWVRTLSQRDRHDPSAGTCGSGRNCGDFSSARRAVNLGRIRLRRRP